MKNSADFNAENTDAANPEGSAASKGAGEPGEDGGPVENGRRCVMGPKVRRAGHDASQQIELRAQRVSAWWLATARGALGWTLEQMAIYFRCSRSTCVNYECFDGVRGTPLPDYRRRMLTMLLAKRGLLAEVDRRVEAREQALSVGRIG